MSWDSPSQTKLFLGAAAVVLVAGWVAIYKDCSIVLSAPSGVSVRASSDMRDAVASPAMPIASGGWFQAGGAAALSRAAQAPSPLSAIKEALQPRPTTGRSAYSGRRVIVDRVSPGVPEPVLTASR